MYFTVHSRRRWSEIATKATIQFGLKLFVGIVVFVGAAHASASEPATTKRGHDLVSDNCSVCHAIGKTGDSPLAAAPHFRDLHQRYDVEFLMEALVEGITTAHPEMPEFRFSSPDAAAIVAYLSHWKNRKPETEPTVSFLSASQPYHFHIS
ncbi:Hypothetical protein NGAL_HAMBI1146_21470 [Neorhizobium galegae bv. officinalis]|nr:Hypothetical protein NGAL_HAMBI1146_21470 [Neorhizobium galegae bv. officinalis]